jgi:sulfatase modifying factor 1
MRFANSHLVCGVLLAIFATEALAVTINWSPVGNPGNAPDTAVMTGDGTSGYGAVGYAYNIGTYDVTNSQYAEFLNTKDPTGANTLGLWNSNMADLTQGGINFNAGNAVGNKYTLISGAQNHPVSFETWYDAIRFANWLNNGQGSGDTETGAYTVLGGTPTPSNGPSITRNAGATVFLPSEDEWYKAAYYDPRTTAQGGPPSDSHYWLYPTSSNTTPTASNPTALPNHANFPFGGPFLGGPLNPTDVGAYSGTTSPYGAFDMGGNVWQRNEALIPGSFRGVRGGSFSYYVNPGDALMSTFRLGNNAGDVWGDVGFRVASVASIPEPSSLVLAAFGFIGFAAWGWRRQKRSHA